MSRRQQTMRMLRRSVVLCAAVIVLSGCGGGPDPFTNLQVSGVNGGSGDVGPIALRDVVFAYPGDENVFGYRTGEDVALDVTIVNSSDTPDRLISVTSPVARGVIIAGPTTVAGHDSLTSIADATELGSGAVGQSPAPKLRIVLTDVREPIQPGFNTPVTFRFRAAGQVTLAVPIDAPLENDPGETGAGGAGEAGAGDHSGGH